MQILVYLRQSHVRDNGSDDVLKEWVLVEKRLEGSLKFGGCKCAEELGCVIRSDYFLVAAKICWIRLLYERIEEKKVNVIIVNELVNKEKRSVTCVENVENAGSW